MNTNRTFAPGERSAIRRIFGHTCVECGAPVSGSEAHVDHIIAHANGGETVPANAQLLCRDCNLRKGSRNGRRPTFNIAKPPLDINLREWQRDCLEQQREAIDQGRRSFFTAAGVGAGKTIAGLALYLAHDFDMVIVVTPKSGIRGSWQIDARRMGIWLESVVSANSFLADDGGRRLPNGFVINIHMLPSVMNEVAILCQMFKVLLVIDEAHHYGEDMVWTENLAAAIGSGASFTLAMSGTPYRGDNKRISCLDYVREGRGMIGTPMFTRSYEDSLSAGEVAPIVSRFIGGEVIKQELDGRAISYDYADGDYSQISGGTPDFGLMSERLRLSAVESFDWQMAAINESRNDLLRFRQGGTAWGGLIICATIEQSRRIKERIESRWGDRCKLIVAEADTEEAVADFIADESYLWAISITKVSEGISIDRLRVGVLLTTTTTRGNFEQVRGRLARLIKGTPHLDQTAVFYIPADPRLIDYAMSSNQIMQHAIPWLDPTLTEAEAMAVHTHRTGPANIDLDGSPMARGNTTADMIAGLRAELARSREDLTTNVGSYTLIARPRMDGAAIGDEFLSEDEYLQLRQELAAVIHPITAMRANGWVLERLRSDFGRI